MGKQRPQGWKRRTSQLIRPRLERANEKSSAMRPVSAGALALPRAADVLGADPAAVVATAGAPSAPAPISRATSTWTTDAVVRPTCVVALPGRTEGLSTRKRNASIGTNKPCQPKTGQPY